MSFNSYSFLLIFLPVTLLVFYLTSQLKGDRWPILWIVGASLVFYGLWDWALTCLLIGSVLINYTLGIFLNKGQVKKENSKKVLCLGIISNLGVLFFFKYFSIYGNIKPQLFASILEPSFIVPIALSFFTFQQIIYLVEIWRGNLNETKFLNYFLFVTFFPQLLNGPIVRPNEFFHQLVGKKFLKLQADQIAAGLTIFSCGLFKKVVLADGIARYSDSAFNAVSEGAVLSFTEAWSGTLSFTLQVYFDFSGYSDMAIGLGCLFGILLPINFESPYKASSLIEFWHRWHMTLSRFVRDYIYIPLGGNHRGSLKRAVNIFMIMVIAGTWHGMGSTFIVWGILHGGFLVLNHFWRQMQNLLGYSLGKRNFVYKISGCMITFLTVAVLWVFFRADNLDVAISIIQSLFGFHTSIDSDFNNIKINEDRLWFLLIIVWFFPNMKEIMSKFYESKLFNTKEYNSVVGRRWYHWHPNTLWAALVTILFIMSLLEISNSKQFIYFLF
jgi:D-alanyl-lipoteichoic acid acyltransferase DltB (MBOAT superfamily)